jgi:hypothetical protein
LRCVRRRVRRQPADARRRRRAICPKCGARNAFTPEFAEALRRGQAAIDPNATVVHSEIELKKQD